MDMIRLVKRSHALTNAVAVQLLRRNIFYCDRVRARVRIGVCVRVGAYG